MTREQLAEQARPSLLRLAADLANLRLSDGMLTRFQSTSVDHSLLCDGKISCRLRRKPSARTATRDKRLRLNDEKLSADERKRLKRLQRVGFSQKSPPTEGK